MKAYGGAEVYLHSFLKSAPDVSSQIHAHTHNTNTNATATAATSTTTTGNLSWHIYFQHSI